MHASHPAQLARAVALRMRMAMGVATICALLLVAGCQPISPDLESEAGAVAEAAPSEDAAPAEVSAETNVAEAPAPIITGLPEITIEVTADGIVVPEGVVAGPTIVHLVNNGGPMNEDGSPALPEVGYLAEGATQEQLVAAMPGADENPGPALELIRIYGSSFLSDFEYAWDLQAGDYLAFTTADPFYMEPFTVGEGDAAAAPQADVEVQLADFSFTMPDEVAAGPQVWQLTNEGKQWHEMVILTLNEGVTPEDVLAFFDTAGPEDVPPFELVMGYAPFSQGNRVWLGLDLAAGDYTVVCFLPDLTGDMAPHVSHGMVRALSVK